MAVEHINGNSEKMYCKLQHLINEVISMMKKYDR